MALLAYFITIYAWNQLSPGLGAAFAGLLVTIVLVLRLMPRAEGQETAIRIPAWDLPARMAAAAAFVLLLTASARALGPQLSGLLSPFPVFGLVLSVFTHRQQGGETAARLLRGLVVGSTAYTAFFLVVGLLLPAISIAPAYLAATFATLAVNMAAFMITRVRSRRGRV